MMEGHVKWFFNGEEDVKVSGNFTAGEFKYDGAYVWGVDIDLIDLCQNIRTALARPVVINSGYRTPEYNERIKGSATYSRHILMKAADLDSSSEQESLELAGAAYAFGCRRMGVGVGLVHVDVAPVNSGPQDYWLYNNNFTPSWQDIINASKNYGR